MVNRTVTLNSNFVFRSHHKILNMSIGKLQKNIPDLAVKYERDLNILEFCQEFAVRTSPTIFGGLKETLLLSISYNRSTPMISKIPFTIFVFSLHFQHAADLLYTFEHIHKL